MVDETVDIKGYDEMSEFEKAQVDKAVEKYRSGSDGSHVSTAQIEEYMSKLDTGKLRIMNEKVDQYKSSKSEIANNERFRRVMEMNKCGLPINENKQSEETKALKEEVSQLRQEVKDLMSIIKEKLC